jgi:hypothetical protein
MKNWLLMAALAGLSACGNLSLNLPPLLGPEGEETITVTRDNVTLAGPHGFCVDQQSSSKGAASAFVVFGNCAAITGKPTAPQPLINAIVTSTVRLADPTVPKIGQSSDQLSSFFESDVGHILLSRTNDPRTVKVLESGPANNGAYFVYVEDEGEGAPEGTDNTYWRAYLDVQSSVVTVSVLSLKSNPLTRREGLEIMRGFTSKIRSAEQPTVAVQDDVVETPTARPTTNSGIRPIIRPSTDKPEASPSQRKGILGRLFG